MKRNTALVIGVVVFLLAITIPIIIHSIKLKSLELQVNTIETANCSGIYEEIYKLAGRTVYLYCLDSMKVKDETFVSLYDYLDKYRNRGIDLITEKMDLVSELKDGGTKIFEVSKKKKFSNNGLKIISCNTLNGDKSIYIGPITMPEDLCN